ncbi:endolytic transglycosylase MltG [Nonomuraea insulae]|uniref:Endolytic murein transglycosylase n=1 Tax=Nonomuraea insulae TaxID=1616787 RepID=A0ABW1DG67_9ACTN
MSIEDLLRETLADMAHEEPAPHPDRFLRPVRARRRGVALAAAAAVVVLAAGGTVAVQTLSEPVPLTAVRPALVKSKVTIRAGLRLADLLDLLARTTGKPVESFAQAVRDDKALGLPSYAKGRLEGFAYPGTYEYTASSTPTEILAAMVARFRESAERLGLESERAVIIASLVQAESPSEADMPKVSRVIHNRLARGMFLQLDSTVLYGLGRYGTKATLKDVKSKSPYNTYRRRGLPPGPITNPGEAALKAALHPATGPWLHFVVIDPKNGTLDYATSQAELTKLIDRTAG